MLGLTPSARLIRGFRRIGTALAALALFIGIVSTIAVAFDHANKEYSKYNQMLCMHEKLLRNKLQGVETKYKPEIQTLYDPYQNGCEGYYIYRVSHDQIVIGATNNKHWISEFIFPLFIGLCITLGVAIVLYCLSCTIGWIAAGFARDHEPMRPF